MLLIPAWWVWPPSAGDIAPQLVQVHHCPLAPLCHSAWKIQVQIYCPKTSKFRHHALCTIVSLEKKIHVHHHHDLTVAEADFPLCSPSVGSWTVWWTPRRFLPSQRCLRPTGFPICLTQDLSKSWKLTERIDFAKTQAHWLFAVLLGLVSEMPPSLPSWLWSSMIHDRDHRRCIIIRFTCRTLRGAHPSHQTLRWCRAFSGLHRLRQRPTPDLAYCQIISNPN